MITKKLFILTIFSFLAIGMVIGLSANASAQQVSSIPSWVKTTALWWGQGQISDADFIKGLQWLINQGILVVPNSPTTPNLTQQSSTSNTINPTSPGISNMVCSRDEVGIIHITGKFSSNNSYSFASLVGAIEDSSGNVLATGLATLENVQPGVSKIFDIEIVHSGVFAKCEVQLQNTMP